MTDGKKIVGICLSKVHDDFRKDLLNYLYMNTVSRDIKLLVFNSLRDLYYGDKYDEGSKSVFRVINYDILDALVILSECFYDNETVENIIKTAQEHKIPVILVHGEHDGCYCIVKEYKESYKSIIRHVIKDHGVKRPFFIGGRKTEDPSTELRLECFREVLDECGMTFTEDMLAYGEYWDVPTTLIIRRLATSGFTMPDAFICANDTTAMTVCEELEKNGFNVPRDVIVTGFDGLISALFFMPRLTTCSEDIQKLARLTVDIIEGSISGRLETGIFKEEFRALISESCGCGNDDDINYRQRARSLYKQVQEIQNHEEHIYTWVDRILDSDSLNTLSAALSDYILPNSCVCLTENFIVNCLGINTDKKERSNDEYIVISSMDREYKSGKQGRLPAGEIVPDLRGWLNDTTLCIISPIFVGSQICGYYTAKTDNILVTAHKLFRVSKTMNIAFGSMMNRNIKHTIQSSMLNAKYIDALSGLPNLKGLSKWFDDFSASEENHRKTLMVSIYTIPQYKYIFENYGIEDIEEVVKFIAEALSLANKDNGYIARTGHDEFVVVNHVDNENDVSVVIDNAVSVFYSVIEGYNSNSEKDYFIEVNCGCTVVNPGWSSTLRSFIKLANAEMYMNRLKEGQPTVVKEDKPAVTGEKTPSDLYSEFSILIEKNLFTYFFQPIIDAKTGNIVAYEALMRTTGGIKMSPLDILAVAKEYNMLYDIEKATMFNVMDRYVTDIDKFDGKKVFINTIPGNFLKNGDLEKLKKKYGQYISNFVFEITEQDTVSDSELSSMRLLGVVENRGSDTDLSGGQIAVDDYGTGHSNIVNLLRYAPHIIKIDRFLITNIQNDPNKQMFVKSTIEFARMNNIKVLAEGVETYEEMKTVIEYGVDLIQGYYTSRPAEEPVAAIPENIRKEVISENISLSRYDNGMLTYYAKDGDTLNLYDLALEKYSCIVIGNVKVTLKGTREAPVTITVVTADNSNAEITLEDVFLKAGEDKRSVIIGAGSSTVINLAGKNTITKDGIYVPEEASLTFKGDGDLSINANRNNGVGIGSCYDVVYGSIIFEQTGSISVETSGDKAIAIGGGLAGENTSITFNSGFTHVSGRGILVVGIGAVKGRSVINIFEDAHVKAECVGNESCALGAFSGEADIHSIGTVEIVSDGEKSCAFGSLGSEMTRICLEGGRVSAVVHGDSAVCIGSIGGHTDIRCSEGYFRAYGEGDKVCGFGSSQGTGTTHITGGTVSVELLSGDPRQFGSSDCKTIITSGNILAAKPGSVSAFNAFDEKLHFENHDGSFFEKYIKTDKGDYVYRAEKDPTDEKICVYIP